MHPALARLVNLFAAAPRVQHTVPHTLLEHAGACAGRDPRQARELRAAAAAAMRVVR